MNPAVWNQELFGHYSPLTGTIFGKAYTHTAKKLLGYRVKTFRIFFHNGLALGFAKKKELDSLGKKLAKELVQNPCLSKEWAADFKEQAELVRSTIRKYNGKPIRKKHFKLLSRQMQKLIVWFIAIQQPIHHLPLQKIAKINPVFVPARKIAKTIFIDFEEFMENWATIESSHTNCPPHLFLCVTEAELFRFFRTRKLPRIQKLINRYSLTTLDFQTGEYKSVFGKRAKQIEQKTLHHSQQTIVIGQCAYPGKIVGTARILLNPLGNVEFHEHDILILPKTRPEYFPLIKKASAIVTDQGGITSHAATICRELKKPCIVDTDHATRIFKNGDKVSMDAEKGIVRKIS